MTDSLIQTLAIGVLAALLAFELLVALASWLEAGGADRSTHRGALAFTRPFAIRDHFRERQRQVTALRGQYPILRSSGHGHRVRKAIRNLQATRVTALLMDCSMCRGSRMRGLPHCPTCGRRLLAPADAAPA